ncbi:hypothetical protein, partial [Nitrosococcus oceani]|uniref:hypothetical protein n=1 Tax=Nitrosococcus oceani TaxID=1229 RepID=UPI00056D24A2
MSNTSSAVIDFSKAETPKPEVKSKDNEKRTSRLTDIINLAKSSLEMWHDENRDPYASFEANSHKEHWAIDSRGFKEWL